MLESTETGRALVVALMKYAPSLTMKEAQKVFSEEVEDEELEQVLPMVKECVPEADDPELNTWEGFVPKWCEQGNKRNGRVPTRLGESGAKGSWNPRTR